MNPQTPQQPNVMDAARAAMPPAGAPQMPPQAPIAPPKSNLPVPPPGIALKLAQQAPQMPPMVLGTLLWRGLQQHGQAIGNLSPHFHAQPAMGGQSPMPGGMPMGGQAQ